MLAARADTGGGFKPSIHDLRVRGLVYLAVPYLSLSLCTTTLFIIALLAIHPVSRPMLDRVSFRILVYAIIEIVIQGVASVWSNGMPSHWTCPIAGPVLVFGVHGSSFLSFCIGLNLQLVMIHGFDGQKAEKFYVGGSLALALVLGIVCFVSKQWSYNPELNVCWIYDPNPVKLLVWQLGTQQLWNFLTMAGELVTFTSVIVHLMRLKVFDSGPRAQASQRYDHTNLSASRQYPKPRGPKQYRNFVLRIALYPLISLVTIGITTIANVYLAARGLRSRADLRLLFATRTIYQARGGIYSLIAFMDPALSRGFKSLYRHYRPRIKRNTVVNSFDSGLGSGVNSEDLRSVGDHVELAISQTSHGNQGATASKPDPCESHTSDVTLPLRPAPAARLSTMRQHLRYEQSLRGRSHLHANANVGRIHNDEEYSEFERRL